ncbi:vesicle transport protein SEC20-like [Watersipora subatra]|uniref:vesicle transport protein SEC20-like n=1 Tax=Watersipora subatra TaxID=2589382 RepID=UPI00355ACE6D
MKQEDELIKLSLAANAAIQDVQMATEKEDENLKEHVSKLIARAKECILAFKSKIVEIENDAVLVDKETDKAALDSLVKKWKQELRQANIMFKRVHLNALAVIEQREKTALIGSGSTALSTRKRIVDKQSAAKGSSSITDSLVHTSRMMAEHLQRSSDTIETLSNSSKGITLTNEELKNMQGHIKNSRSLLTKYGRKEMTDRLFLFLAVAFFLATVLYIIKKRLWSSDIAMESFNAPQENVQDPVIV